MIKYNQDTKRFSLVYPNLTKLDALLTSNFKKRPNWSPVGMAFELEELYHGDDQLQIRNMLILRANDFKDESVNLKRIYFIGKNVYEDIIGVNITTGEVYCMSQTDPDSYCEAVSPNLRDYGKSILDRIKHPDASKLTRAREFLDKLPDAI